MADGYTCGQGARGEALWVTAVEATEREKPLAVSAPGSLVKSFLWRCVLRSARAPVTPRAVGCAIWVRAFAAPPPPPAALQVLTMLPLLARLTPPTLLLPPPPLLLRVTKSPSPRLRLLAALAAAPQARHSRGAAPCQRSPAPEAPKSARQCSGRC